MRQGSSSARRGSNQTSPALGVQPESSTSNLVSEMSSAAAGGGGGGHSSSTGRQGSRDENSYYQAETATLTRENQMLRLRIRELGKSALSLFILLWGRRVI